MLLKPQSIKLQFIFSAIFLVLWVLWRVVLIYIEPLNSDEIFALYNGKTMIENGLFFGYTDIKIGWAYFSGVIYKLIGFSPFGYRFIGILITIFTAYLIGLVAKNIFGKDYQIIAFVFYLFFSGMYLLQVHYITAELFQNVFFVLLVVSILRKNKNYFFIGFLIFCVGLIRPASFFDVVMLFLWLRVSTRWRDNIDIRGYYQIIIGVFLSLAVLIIYLIWIDRLSELLNYVSIMRNYTSSSDGSREEYLRLFIDRNFLPLAWVYVFPLMGLLFGVKNFKAISLPLFLLIGSMIDFNSPGYYFPHYQQVLFPALALFSAYGLRQLYIILPDKMKTTAIVVISGLFLVIAYFNNVSIVFGKIKSYSEQHDSTYVDALMYYSKDGGGDRHLIRDDIMKNGGEKNNIFAWSDSQYYHVSIPISHVYGNITFRDEVLPSKLQYKTHRGYLKGTNPQKKLTELVNELTNDMPDYVVIEYSPEQTANDSLEARELFGLFANSYDFTMATYGNLLLSRNLNSYHKCITSTS